MNTKELITIVKSKFAEQSVSARELHQKLEVRSRYNDWIKQMIDYGFEENKDYIAITEKKVTAQGNESTLKSHYISLDMAKEICMLQRSDIGRAFRKYFIEVEKEFSAYKVTRAKSKVARNRFTEELKERGYNKPHEYIQTTNQVNYHRTFRFEACNYPVVQTIKKSPAFFYLLDSNKLMLHRGVIDCTPYFKNLFRSNCI